jgi:hypothetical protein
MGANSIRSHTLGVSVGSSFSVWPKANQVNNAAFDSIDYAVMAANRASVSRPSLRSANPSQATVFG